MATIKSKEDLTHVIGESDLFPILNDGGSGKSVAPSQIRTNIETAVAQIVFVGATRPYTTVQDALDSITDNAVDKPYLVKVDPGTYTSVGVGLGFETKDYVRIEGSGRLQSRIGLGLGSTRPAALTGDGWELSNLCFYIEADTGSINSELGMLSKSGVCNEAVISDCFIDCTNIRDTTNQNRWAIFFGSGTNSLHIYNTIIKTNMGGIRWASGFLECFGCDIYLTGKGAAYTGSNIKHVGIKAAAASRVSWWGGRIGTGYRYEQDLGDPGNDVICVWGAAGLTSATHIHNAIMFARNPNADLGVRVNCIYNESTNGSAIRLSGSRMQTELDTNTNSNVSESMATNSTGKIEFMGSIQHAGIEADSYTTQTDNGAISTLTAAANITREDGGIVLLLGSGDYTVKVSLVTSSGSFVDGVSFFFMNRTLGTTDITVTLEMVSGTVNGGASITIPPGEVRRCISVGDDLVVTDETLAT